MSHWANDFVGMPGRFFQELVTELYNHNKLIKGEFTIRGRRVDLRNIRQPLLVVAASQDNIVPPLAAKGLMDAVSSQDKEYLEMRGGHISVFSGRQANKVMWPKLDEWLTQHSV
jgi:polyhydroxyalkanoate synthase